MTVNMVYRLAGSVGGGSVPSLRDDESPEGGSIDGTGEVKNRKESSSKECESSKSGRRKTARSETARSGSNKSGSGNLRGDTSLSERELGVEMKVRKVRLPGVRTETLGT